MSEIRRSEESQQEIKQEYKTMTFEEYQGHETPYVYEVKKDAKKITFYGAAHSYDSKDPQFKEIEKKFKEANPEVVFVEGMNSLSIEKIIEELKGKSDEKVIQEMGEQGFTLKLAAKAG